MSGEPSPSRFRWAAIGAILAVTLGGGGVGVVGAVQSTGPRGAYNAIEPCRLVDTRPAHGIGGRTTPLGPDETYELQGSGDHGECTGIPGDAIALALNVTPVGPTRRTNVRFWPDGPVPNASSLNPAPGQPPTPNAVTVDLAADGSFRVYNLQGHVHLVADIVGYYRDHDHDDRYHTIAEADAALDGKADRQRTLVIPPASFQGIQNDPPPEFFAHADGAYITMGGAAGLTAPITVPVGSVITTVRYHLWDTSAVADLNAYIEVGDLATVGIGALAGSSAGTDGSSGYQVGARPLDHAIRNDQALQVRVYASGQPWSSAGGSLRIKAVEVDYVLP